jgi:hypothetical protein
VRGLVWALDRDIEVRGLRGRQLGQLDVELGEVGTGNLLIKFLGQHVDTERELLRRGPQGDLSQDLVGERARHDERRVTSSAT